MFHKVACLVCASLLMATLTGCNEDGPLLAIIGLDKNGKELKVKVSEAEFGPKFSEVLNTASVSSMETLTEEQARSNWGLQEVEVGVDLQISGKIETIVNVGVGSGASLTLTRENAGAAHE